MTKLSRFWKTILAIAISAIFSMTARTAAAATQTVNLGFAISLEMLLPVLVAQQKHYFTENGIDLHLLPLGGPQTRDALASGQINFALFHVAPVWIAVSKGLPFRFVSMYYTKEIFGVLAGSRLRGKVKSIADLKGLQGLSATPGAASYAASVFYFQRFGIDINKDVRMTYLASTDPNIWINSIATGKVDFLAGVWEPVFTTAIRRGVAFPLFDPANPKQHTQMFGGDVSTLGLVTTTTLIKSDPALVKRMVHCVNLGLADIPKESDKALVDMVRAGGDIKIDRADLASVIHRIRGNFEHDGSPSVSKYARAVAAYRKSGYLKKNIPYDAVIDPSFAGKAP